MTEKIEEKCLCRACGEIAANRASACVSCGSSRIARHSELESLAIAHVDCDAFYASIEKRDAPELADKPVIVGGGQRGVVTTACYIARTFGVRSAMPMFKALKVCPAAVVIKPDFAKYVKASREVRALMNDLTPIVEPISIDEAFLDLAGTSLLHGQPPARSLWALQQKVKNEIGITVSVGLSHNKFLAKIASDLEKPDGFTLIGKAETVEFLAGLPVSKIAGVGAAFEKRLASDGIRSIAALQKIDGRDLMRRYGATGQRLGDLAHGRDTRRVIPSRETKSVSAETTFDQDVSDREFLTSRLWELSEKVSRRMKEKNLEGRVVTLKLKTSDFKSFTKRVTLETSSNLARVLFARGEPLLASAISPGVAYRLIGIGYADLLPAGGAHASQLFETDEEKWAKQESAIDQIRTRFGEAAIGTGRAASRPLK